MLNSANFAAWSNACAVCRAMWANELVYRSTHPNRNLTQIAWLVCGDCTILPSSRSPSSIWGCCTGFPCIACLTHKHAFEIVARNVGFYVFEIMLVVCPISALYQKNTWLFVQKKAQLHYIRLELFLKPHSTRL